MEQPRDEHQMPIKPIYSRGAVWGFCIFFFTASGGILLMQNLKQLEKHKAARAVLWFSIGFTLLSLFLIVAYPKSNTSFAYVLNLIGAGILGEYFFKKHIPEDHRFGRRKIWKPLLFTLLVMFPLLVLYISLFFKVTIVRPY